MGTVNMRLKDIFGAFRLRGNVYWSLLLHFGFVILLYSLCRVAFYLFNKEFFPEISLSHFIRLMAGGLRFDLAALLYLNAVFILFYIIPWNLRFNVRAQRIAAVFFVVVNATGLAANLADFVYYRFTLKRTTWDLFAQFSNETNMGRLILHFLFDYWYALVAWIVLVALCVWVVRKIRITGPMISDRLVYFASGGALMLLITYFVVIGMRGGFGASTRPITLSNAGQYVNDPREISIVLNTPFALMRTMKRTQIQQVEYYPAEVIDSVYTPVIRPESSAFRGMNVVVIILESFSKEFVGFYNRDRESGTYRGYTPFLDSLLQYSLTFEWSFANGRKSIDGLPSVVSGIPSMGVPYFLSPHSGNRINSLASLLKPRGYHSSFFHGAPNGSMGFQAFMNIAGFDSYFGYDEYGNSDDSDGIWGIWDHKFFDFYADKLNTFPEPFVSVMFSVSSHHPFEVPDEFEGRFSGGPLVIHKCIQYTDYSLKRFFEKVSGMPWYNNTLFVITADHTSSEIQFEDARSAWGVYSIPIVFFKGDNSLKEVKPGLAQQADIMPTILGYLGYDKPYLAFGHNHFDRSTLPFAVNYRDNVYQFFQDDYLLQFDGARSVGLYRFTTDRLLKENLLGDSTRLKAMEGKLKGIIQQYNNRMISNSLTVNSN